MVLGVHKRDHNVASATGGRQAFVVVSQASRMHQAPAFTGGLHFAVVADKAATASLHVGVREKGRRDTEL